MNVGTLYEKFSSENQKEFVKRLSYHRKYWTFMFLLLAVTKVIILVVIIIRIDPTKGGEPDFVYQPWLLIGGRFGFEIVDLIVTLKFIQYFIYFKERKLKVMSSRGVKISRS